MHSEERLMEYQKNMKTFIKDVEKEMSLIIDKYEREIKQLKCQIKDLRLELSKRDDKLEMSPINSKGDTDIKKTLSNAISDLTFKAFCDCNLRPTQVSIPGSDLKLDGEVKSRFEVSRGS
jgi:hypothetical protein